MFFVFSYEILEKYLCIQENTTFFHLKWEYFGIHEYQYHTLQNIQSHQKHINFLWYYNECNRIMYREDIRLIKSYIQPKINF